MILRPVALVALTLSIGLAQQFEVASIKPSAPGDVSNIHWLPGGRFVASKSTVMNLISFAFEMPAQQVAGVPAWLTSERFDISAKPDAPLADDPARDTPRTRRMLQALLESRFSLRYHRETQERPAYELVVARNGPKLKTNSGAEFEITRRGRHQFVFRKVTMVAFARSLSGPLRSDELGRPVVDRTGLAGEYDFTLEWASEIILPGRTSKSSHDLGGPSVFTAVQELGLRLQTGQAPLEILVIDAVEEPSEN